MTEQQRKRLKADLKHVVSSAALGASAFVGTGGKEAGDQAAVDAMRMAFNEAEMDAIVKVGEGEKDEAPMLFVNERLGNRRGLKLDIAVDPVEGTALMASGQPNAIAVVAAAESGSFWDAGAAYYMDKIVVGPEAKGAIDIRNSIQENLASIAKATNKKCSDLVVYVLDKPRHKELINEIEACGAQVDLHPEGDVIGSVLALLPEYNVDALMGIGGAPEAVITAAAVLALGGDMQGQLVPQLENEQQALEASGVDLNQVLFLDDLVKGDWAVFAAAGVTSGAILDGPVVNGRQATVEHMIIGPDLGQIEKNKQILFTD